MQTGTRVTAVKSQVDLARGALLRRSALPGLFAEAGCVFLMPKPERVACQRVPCQPLEIAHAAVLACVLNAGLVDVGHLIYAS